MPYLCVVMNHHQVYLLFATEPSLSCEQNSLVK
jgi:hypothetical protein